MSDHQHGHCFESWLEHEFCQACCQPGCSAIREDGDDR